MDFDTFMTTTFPDANKRTELIDLIKCLNDPNQSKKIIVFKGLGNNGRTTLLNMIKRLYISNYICIPKNATATFSKKLIVIAQKNNGANLSTLNPLYDLSNTLQVLYICESYTDDISNSNIVKIFNFDITFVDNPTLENEKQRIPNLNDYYEEWAKSFRTKYL